MFLTCHLSRTARLLSQSSFSVLAVQMAGIALTFKWPGITTSSLPNLSLPPSVKSRVQTSLGVFTLISVLVSMYRSPSQAPQPYRPGPRILRAGIWTVHFGIDNEGRDSQRRIRDLIRFVVSVIWYLELCTHCLRRDMELDVVGLLETDLHVSLPPSFRCVRADCNNVSESVSCTETETCE